MLASEGVAPGALEFRILGPFEVLEDGRRLRFAPGQEQALLAVLVLHRNERVSIDRLTDLLWDESPPESAPKMVRIYVSRLRRALAAAGGLDQRLVTQAAGYRLQVEPDELDLDRFERLLGEGRAALADGDAALAVARLRDALSLWRGPPLTGVSEARFLERESARLDELRLSAREEQIEAQLALGKGPELVDELEALVREHPLRERPAVQLMRATSWGSSPAGRSRSSSRRFSARTLRSSPPPKRARRLRSRRPHASRTLVVRQGRWCSPRYPPLRLPPPL